MTRQALTVTPWNGGLNTAQKPSELAPQEYTVLDNVVLDAERNPIPREGIDANWDDTSSGTGILALHDFWFENLGQKDHKLVSVNTDGNIRAYTLAGSTSILDSGSYSLGSTSIADISTFTNRAVIVTEPVAGSTSMMFWDGVKSTVERVVDSSLFTSGDNSPPNCSLLRPHLNRLWTNDLNIKDRINYSETENLFKWQGSGDSGALDIRPGDGDPRGVTAIFPPYKGNILTVAKLTKLYRVDGTTPSTFTVTDLSSGIGCVSHNAVVATEDDIYWVSLRGIHSLRATDKFGDVESAFISAPIQKDFNSRIERSMLDKAQANYLPELNSICFSLADKGSSTNNILYWYHIPTRRWFTWSNVDAQSIAKSNDGARERLYFGRSDGRVAKTQTYVYIDLDTSGVEAGYTTIQTTGRIAPDATLYTDKAFKQFGLLYDETDTHQIEVTVKVDRFDNQSITYTESSDKTKLGLSFILGTDIVGELPDTAPRNNVVDGVGRAFQLTVTQQVNREWVEIQGFFVEWEPGSARQEVINGE